MATFFMLSSNLYTQDYSVPTRIFKRGQTDIQIGYGLFTGAKIMDKADTKFPPLSFRGDRFMGDHFSLGVSYTIASHQSQPFIIPDGIEQRITNTTHQMAVRPTFHMTSLKKMDLYGGMLIGLNFEEFKIDQGTTTYMQEHKNFQPQRTKVIYSAFVGSRYVLSKNWSVFSELGFSTALLMVGIGYRI